MLGNGINRCINSDVSWGCLLDKIADRYNVKLNKEISFPMQFESIVNQMVMNPDIVTDDIYLFVKNEILSLIKEASLADNAPHKALVDKADAIITTNYDFLIEQSLDNSFSIQTELSDSKKVTSRYNLRNSVFVSNKEIFHIHGDLRAAKSICLGYEHYVGTVQHLREAIARKKTDGGNIPAIVLALRNPENTTDTWAEKFFTDNIHIIGLGLSWVEIDIWWLITYRASLLYTNQYNCRDFLNNKIVYHDIGMQPDENMKFTLENLAVDYTFYPITEQENRLYLEKYIEIANTIL